MARVFSLYPLSLVHDSLTGFQYLHYLFKLLAAISYPVLHLSRNEALKNGTHWQFISLKSRFQPVVGKEKENVGLNLHLYHLRLMTQRSAGNNGRKEFDLVYHFQLSSFELLKAIG